MTHRFLAAAHPPAALDGPALVVHVGATTVAVGDGESVEDAHFVGILDGRPVWAVDAEPADGGVPLLGLWGSVDDVVWTVAGRAVQLVEWDRTHRFCGRCATPTEPSVPPERARRCPACGLPAFPRLAPAMIVLVTRDGGREALLARGARFPMPMWSCLAGFVEPGETLEEAVHREVMEEVGITVDDVRYWGSQPWPFPHSLMLGCTASYAGGDLVLDPVEIADAGWYTADDLPPVPPSMSIARRIINAWVESRAAS